MYNFDTVVQRKGTASRKWDYLIDLYGDDEVLPLWVADMDFKSPPEVIDALMQRAEHGVYGYTGFSDQYYEEFIGWAGRRYHWLPERDWIHFSPGVVTGLCLLINALTKPGDQILLLTPVYYPFLNVVRQNGRIVADCPLKNDGGFYTIDYELLESRAKDAKLLMFCNPHNPVGRVWSREELEKVADICLRNKVTIISDDIHCDIIMKGYQYIPIASLSPEAAQITVTCMAPSKTFNIAGLKTSMVITSSREISRACTQEAERYSLKTSNLFGETALKVAYRTGDRWVDELCGYLEGNIDYVIGALREMIPGIVLRKPEGTYLLWADFRGTAIENPFQFMVEQAKVAPSDGTCFSVSGSERFVRFNIASPRLLLEEAMRRIRRTISAQHL